MRAGAVPLEPRISETTSASTGPLCRRTPRARHRAPSIERCSISLRKVGAMQPNAGTVWARLRGRSRRAGRSRSLRLSICALPVLLPACDGPGAQKDLQTVAVMSKDSPGAGELSTNFTASRSWSMKWSYDCSGAGPEATTADGAVVRLPVVPPGDEPGLVVTFIPEGEGRATQPFVHRGMKASGRENYSEAGSFTLRMSSPCVVHLVLEQ